MNYQKSIAIFCVKESVHHIPDDWVALKDAQAAAYAACGYTRSTGRPSFVIAYGLGQALQSASAMLTSWGDKQQVVALNKIDRNDFSVIKNAYSAVTRGSFVIQERREISNVVNRIREIISQKSPIHVIVSNAVNLNEIVEEWLKADGVIAKAAQPVVSNDTIKKAAGILNSFKKPVIMLGTGAIKNCDPSTIASLAHKLGSPVLLTASATTMPHTILERYVQTFKSETLLIPSGNLVWVKAFASADGILALGSALSEVDWCGLKDIKISRARIIRVGLEEQNPEIGYQFISMDAECFSQKILQELSKMGVSGVDGNRKRKRMKKLEKACQTWKKRIIIEAKKCENLDYIEPRLAAYEIVRNAPDNTLFISEGGACGMWLWSYLWLRPIIFPVQHGTIGVPVPMTIGAMKGSPANIVWNIVGDGAFFYNARELQTLKNSGLSPVFFVFNDSSWSAIRLGQTFIFRGRYKGTDIQDTNYAGLANLYGCEGISVTKPAELTKAVQYAKTYSNKIPLVIDIKMRKDHLPYAGANFVLAELDGAIKSILLQSTLSFIISLIKGTMPKGTFKSLFQIGRN